MANNVPLTTYTRGCYNGDRKRDRPSGSRPLREAVHPRRDTEDDDDDDDDDNDRRVDDFGTGAIVRSVDRVGSLPARRSGGGRAKARAPQLRTPQGGGETRQRADVDATAVNDPRERCNFPDVGGGLAPSNNDDDDNDASSARNFNEQLERMSNFRQLSRAERRRLLSEVKMLLGEGSMLGGGRRGGSDDDYDDYDDEEDDDAPGGPSRRHHRRREDDDEDESLLAPSSCDDSDESSRAQMTLDTNNASTAFYTADTRTQFTADTRTQFTADTRTQFTADTRTQFTADTRTQFTADTTASMSDDGHAARSGARHRHRSGGAGRARRSAGSDSSLYDGLDDDDNDYCYYYDDDGIFGACDSFISFILCEGDAEVDIVDSIHVERRRRDADTTPDMNGEDRRGKGRDDHPARRAENVNGREDPPGISASESEGLEIEITMDDARSARRRRTSSPCVADGVAVPSVKPTLFARAKSFTRHRPAAAPECGPQSDDDVGDAAAAAAIVVPDKPERLGRAKSLTMQRWKSPFSRAKPSSSSENKTSKSDGALACVLQNDGSTVCSDPSSGINVHDGPPRRGSPIAREKRRVWWEHEDEVSGRRYYSDGLISTWERPADVVIFVSSASTTISDECAFADAASAPGSSSTSASMEKRDRRGSLSGEGERKSTRERKKFNSFFGKKKAPQALAGTLANPRSRPKCLRQ